MSKNLESVYAKNIKGYIDMKRKLGFKFYTGEVLLSQFDKFAEDRNEISLGISKEFANCWGERRSYESEQYRYERVRCLAQFSSYLRDKGIESYIPRLPLFKQNRMVPYIYSHDEMLKIFHKVDNLRLAANSCGTSHLFSMPVIFRVLYATGIRIGEAIALNDEDVNLAERFIRIVDSKNGKERIVPISDSLVSVCQEYKHYKSQLRLCDSKSDSMFVNRNRERCSANSVRFWFKNCVNELMRSNKNYNISPRVHDLRHTFAVRTLAQMAESGVDLYASLPILSVYLGHNSISSTNYYVRLTSNSYPDLIKEVDQICLNVFPKTNYYETD
jgi:integrase/recombinase XerD